MRPLTETLPKALVPVLGKPFAYWQLSLLAEQGVRRVVYCVGYRGDMIREFVGDGSSFGLAVEWSDDGSVLLGTAGAIRRALDREVLDDAFIVLYGDSYLPVSIPAVEEVWSRNDRPALMTVLRNEGAWDRSNCIYADGRVVLYDKSPLAERRAEMHWIDYGLSVLSKTVVGGRVAPGAVADLAEIQRELSMSGQLSGMEVKERFYEAGSPQGLRELEAYLLTRSPERGGRKTPTGRTGPG